MTGQIRAAARALKSCVGLAMLHHRERIPALVARDASDAWDARTGAPAIRQMDVGSPAGQLRKSPSAERGRRRVYHEAARWLKRSGEACVRSFLPDRDVRRYASSVGGDSVWLAPINTFRWARGDRVKIASAASAASETLTRSSTAHTFSWRSEPSVVWTGQTFELGLPLNDRRWMSVETGVLGRGPKEGPPFESAFGPLLFCNCLLCVSRSGTRPPTAGLSEVLRAVMVVALSSSFAHTEAAVFAASKVAP